MADVDRPAPVGSREDLAELIAEIEMREILARVGTPFRKAETSLDWQVDAET